MYTKNPQIRISLLNYSHSSINLSFDVLDGLFRQLMSHLFQYVDYQILYHCLTSLEKNNFLNIFSESHQILVTRVLIFGSCRHSVRKCMAKLYAVYVAGA